MTCPYKDVCQLLQTREKMYINPPWQCSADTKEELSTCGAFGINESVYSEYG